MGKKNVIKTHLNFFIEPHPNFEGTEEKFFNDSSRLAKEPVISFYRDIILSILELHPPKLISNITEADDIFFSLKIREDLQDITSLSEAMSHFHGIDHASKFAAMYLARLAKPFKDRLFLLEGNQKSALQLAF